jgi:hypothetical protein
MVCVSRVRLACYTWLRQHGVFMLQLKVRAKEWRTPPPLARGRARLTESRR